ncbi:MAG: hypothetical protein KJP00_06435 [Bacteroidia bacterium]|nr:hypothetical protein [Bacteroidia bacterium]
MKKLILFVIAFLLFTVAQSQNQVKPELSKEYYLQKSKRQKNLAWGLLGGGMASTFVATVILKDNLSFSGETSSEENVADVLFYLGVGSSLASMPLFISADINRKNAAKIAYGYRPLQVDPIFVKQSREHALVFRFALE